MFRKISYKDKYPIIRTKKNSDRLQYPTTTKRKGSKNNYIHSKVQAFISERLLRLLTPWGNSIEEVTTKPSNSQRYKMTKTFSNKVINAWDKHYAPYFAALIQKYYFFLFRFIKGIHRERERGNGYDMSENNLRTILADSPFEAFRSMHTLNKKELTIKNLEANWDKMINECKRDPEDIIKRYLFPLKRKRKTIKICDKNDIPGYLRFKLNIKLNIEKEYDDSTPDTTPTKRQKRNNIPKPEPQVGSQQPNYNNLFPQNNYPHNHNFLPPVPLLPQRLNPQSYQNPLLPPFFTDQYQ